jgi:hypothetical protein
LKAVEPVMNSDIPEDAEVLQFFVFLVESFLANAEFDKIKARLVANGKQQKKELYPNKSYHLHLFCHHSVYWQVSGCQD